MFRKIRYRGTHIEKKNSKNIVNKMECPRLGLKRKTQKTILSKYTSRRASSSPQTPLT